MSQNLHYKQNHDIETLPCKVRIGKSCEKQSKQTWRALGFFLNVSINYNSLNQIWFETADVKRFLATMCFSHSLRLLNTYCSGLDFVGRPQ